MTTLRRGGPIYWLVYGWSHGHFPPPNETNLCRLFWRSVLSVVLMWPIVAALFVVGFPFAARPRLFAADQLGDGPLCEYRHWPTIVGVRLMPVLVAAVGGIVFAIALLFQQFGFRLVVVLGIVAGLYATYLLLRSLDRASLAAGRAIMNTEPYRLVHDFLRAKKARLCPVIQWQGDEADEEGENVAL